MTENIFFQTMEEKEEYEKEHFGTDRDEKYQKWMENGSPELCVLKYKDQKFEVYCGYGQGSVLAKYNEEIYKGKNIIIHENWTIFGDYYGEEVSFVPFVRITKVNQL